jgi:hypothetical protein
MSAHRRLRWVGVSVAALSAASMAGCNRNKVEIVDVRIVSEPGGTRVAAGAEASVQANVSNPGGARLEFRWSSIKGRLHAATTTGPTNIYRAPGDPGPDTITVDVVGGGQTLQKQLQIHVAPPPAPTAINGGHPPPVVFEFPADTMGWTKNANVPSEGLVRIAHNPREGRGDRPGALQVDLDLNAQNPRKTAVEVEVNLTHRTELVSSPVDLSNKTIVFEVKFPNDFPIDRSAPHGVQPFARDDAFHNYYGCFKDVDVAGRWIQVDFPVGPPETSSCAADKARWRQDPGFTPSRVTVIGLKVSANRANRSYRGSSYIDNVVDASLAR